MQDDTISLISASNVLPLTTVTAVVSFLLNIQDKVMQVF